VQVKFQSLTYGSQWKSMAITASGSFYPRIESAEEIAEEVRSAREPLLLHQIASEPVRTL
jgi:hypothetical protein